MKKLISILIMAALVLGVCACSADSQQDPYKGQFRVGFAINRMTPKQSVPLSGYGNSHLRFSEGTLDELMVTGVAVSDEQNNTVLIMAMDLVRLYDPLVEALPAIAEAAGIPVENLIINVSHTHSGPDMHSKADGMADYVQYVLDQTILTAQQAMADRKPVTETLVGDVETDDLNFIRHYILEDGSYAGDSFGDFSAAPIEGHTAQADETMHIVQFRRNGGKDVVLFNWRAHPTITGYSGGVPAKLVSADYLHPFREAISEMADCYPIFLQGAAGNINATSRIKTEGKSVDYMEHGFHLAEYAYEGLTKNMTVVEPGKIQNDRFIMDAQVNHNTDIMYVAAKSVATVWSKTGDKNLALAQAKDIGIRSPYQANAIVSRYDMPATRELEINAIAIGDYIGIVTAPNELFDRNSMYVEENSPYQMTFTLGYTNHLLGYMPSAYVWEYTSYETDVTYFVPGTAEQIQDQMLSMLNALHG